MLKHITDVDNMFPNDTYAHFALITFNLNQSLNHKTGIVKCQKKINKSTF